MITNHREAIAQQLIRVLQNIRDPKPVFVSREPVVTSKLSIQQLPAIVVVTGSELREDISQSSTSGSRRSVITFVLDCYVRGFPLDSEINSLIAAVEAAVELDRTLDGVCASAKVTEINADTPREPPIAQFSMAITVEYNYTRGNP
jgi:hypothetical protein